MRKTGHVRRLLQSVLHNTEVTEIRSARRPNRGAGVPGLVGQAEFDRHDHFGFDRVAIDGGRGIAPEGDGIYGNLREHGIAADAGEAARYSVFSDDGAYAHLAL